MFSKHTNLRFICRWLRFLRNLGHIGLRGTHKASFCCASWAADHWDAIRRAPVSWSLSGEACLEFWWDDALTWNVKLSQIAFAPLHQATKESQPGRLCGVYLRPCGLSGGQLWDEAEGRRNLFLWIFSCRACRAHTVRIRSIVSCDVCSIESYWIYCLKIDCNISQVSIQISKFGATCKTLIQPGEDNEGYCQPTGLPSRNQQILRRYFLLHCLI